MVNISIEDIRPWSDVGREQITEKKKTVEEDMRSTAGNRRGDAFRPLLPPGYLDVEVYKIASAAFRNELVNKQVKVFADTFVMASHLSLPPELAPSVVPFTIYHFSKSTAFATALVPKAMVDALLERGNGRPATLYGQLLARGNSLVLLVERVE